ncbi:hypothetical protein Pan97_34850 [Bremerella volcania]|uniref:Uncharacterized protein n=1 Tax=Bremerella volcania TaxID=2527984 RepID=A0A518CB20_9BACT|nr:hypothetical protein Pan97_34850 [Bremerella volcania]
MWLIEEHPGAASIDCDDCAKWIYDLETGQKATVRVGPERKEEFQPRPSGVPTPCSTCPKKSPENAKECTLSRKNYRTYQFWRMCNASHFHYMPEHLANDPIVARNFAALADVRVQIDENRRNKLFQFLLTGKTTE